MFVVVDAPVVYLGGTYTLEGISRLTASSTPSQQVHGLQQLYMFMIPAAVHSTELQGSLPALIALIGHARERA